MAKFKVRVVTAYVDLGLAKRSVGEFYILGDRLYRACEPDFRAFIRFPFEECWLTKEMRRQVGWIAANHRAEDRFETDMEHVRSNIIQHSPMQWLKLAMAEDPLSDVFVWMGYSIMKQGDFTGKRITPEHVREFLCKLRQWEPNCIPLPGITDRAPVNVHGDNWRFCGSTLIVPRQFVEPLERSYKFETREFIRRHGCIPLDLAIWPMVEERSGLPIRWYKAEYDATQLTNFPG